MPASLSSWQYHNYITKINEGEVIAYPTESIWGLGCDPFNEQAVKNLCRLKNRSLDKGLILIVHDWEQIMPWLKPLTSEVLSRINQDSTIPTTWLLKKNQYLPYWITGNKTHVAVRKTNHPIAKKLTQIFTRPLISTSANPQGLAPARSILKIRCYFGKNLSIVPGLLGHHNQPSQIKNAYTNLLIRKS